MVPKGSVAIVTGGGSGIGLATAKLLASKGVRIVIADIDPGAGQAAVSEIEKQGGEGRFVRTDVTEREDLQAMIDFAVDQFGSVDIFHNNAGVSEGGQSFYEPSSDAWELTVEINLTAVIAGTQLQVYHLRQQGGGGVIINTASMAALVPVPTTPVYAATKAGVVHLCRSLAFLANEGIRVNAVCPTFTDTPLLHRGGEQAVEYAKQQVGGLLKPEQVAEGVLELIRDDSRAGAVMRVTVARGIDYTR